MSCLEIGRGVLTKRIHTVVQVATSKRPPAVGSCVESYKLLVGIERSRKGAAVRIGPGLTWGRPKSKKFYGVRIARFRRHVVRTRRVAEPTGIGNREEPCPFGTSASPPVS